MDQLYDALLVVGFGGPEKREDVVPFLENVLRGRNVPHERMLEVAEHYYHFGGVSPINAQARALIDALKPELAAHGIGLPVYWGNRNWHPMLADTMREIVGDGHRRVLALVLAAYSSYSSCRQYREDIEQAKLTVGSTAPQVDKIRVFYNHPDFIAAYSDRVLTAIKEFQSTDVKDVFVVYTAHSLPMSMATQCSYELQLRESCRLISESSGIPSERYQLVYQSRSGRPQDPWLAPDVCDFVRDLHSRGELSVLIVPVGFLSDHMEVLFDLDEEALHVCQELGMKMVRAKTVGTHPRFIAMLRQLIQERLGLISEKKAIGQYPANHDVCPEDCCPAPVRSTRP